MYLLKALKHIRTLGCLGLFCLAAAPVAGASVPDNYLKRPELRSFIDEMVAKHNFNSVELVTLFGRVKPRPDIIEAISSPAEGKPWYQYRLIFLTPSRISGGVEYWNEHADTLARAEKVYGVPPEIIIAIIGVETRYGTYKGKYPVLDALATLAFDYPKRAAFFRSELEQYLLLTREERIDPLSVKGSYAGAMGGPQFISSSYRRYAVDFDNDGKRDLWEDPVDMIGSVANYFSVHGWQRGEPIATPATVTGSKYKPLEELGLKPQYSLRRIRQYGVTPQTRLPDDELAALITLENENGPEYWLGLQNFYVITRYNHSELYAMAVYQLSHAIAAEREKELAATRESAPRSAN
jgi:membrane-bound lytic murein transglycosylase B